MENQLPILYSFLVYIAFIIFPLIPSYIIYKNFPDTQVGANGLLGNLKINATGAFAAYIITSILGFFLIQFIQGNIFNSSFQTWEVNTVVRYVDTNGSLLPNQNNRVKLTHINVNPFIENQDENFVSFWVTGKGKKVIVSFSSESADFPSKSFNLEKSNKNISIDEVKHTVTIDTILFKQYPVKYNDTNDFLNSTNSTGPPASSMP